MMWNSFSNSLKNLIFYRELDTLPLNIKIPQLFESWATSTRTEYLITMPTET